MHLITREAFALYLRKLAPGGRLLFHIGRQTVDLRPVLAALAGDAGVPARLLLGSDPRRATSIFTVFLPWLWRWRVMVATSTVLPRQIAGQELGAVDAGALWTDQRSDILRVMRLKFGL